MTWKNAGHMMAGVKKALASKKTPAHLKPHLQRRMSLTPDEPEMTAQDQDSEVQEGMGMAKPNAKAPLGQGGRFAALAEKTSPAIAASIGRKKYGKAKFQKMAAAGRKKSAFYGE